jgi:DNA-binding HxlR family transcriptional regulator
MINYYYKHVLDYAIVEILDAIYPSFLRYHELEQEISLHCRIPSSTLSRHLKRLVGKEILSRREEKKYGPTFYSLTKKFKDSLDIQKKHYPPSYLEKTFLLHPFNKNANSFDFKKEWLHIGKKYPWQKYTWQKNRV